MAINTSKVLVGGVAAGVFFSVVDFLTHGVLLADRMHAEMAHVAPAVAENMAAGGNVPVFIAMNLVFGIAAAWLYAAIRPRFGPGMRTASFAGGFLWVVATLMYSSWLFGGMMSASTFAIGSVIWLVALVLGTGIAGRLYSEEAPIAASSPVA